MLDSFLTQIAFFKLRSTGLRVGGGGGEVLGHPFRGSESSRSGRGEVLGLLKRILSPCPNFCKCLFPTTIRPGFASNFSSICETN